MNILRYWEKMENSNWNWQSWWYFFWFTFDNFTVLKNWYFKVPTVKILPIYFQMVRNFKSLIQCGYNKLFRLFCIMFLKQWILGLHASLINDITWTLSLPSRLSLSTPPTFVGSGEISLLFSKSHINVQISNTLRLSYNLRRAFPIIYRFHNIGWLKHISFK